MAPSWRFFTDDEARTVEAITAQLIPSGPGPGAREAGVVYYIDIQLSRRFRKHRKTYREGLAAADDASRKTAGKRFSELNGDQQIAVLNTLEENAKAVLPVDPGAHAAGILWRSAPRRQSQHGELENARAPLPTGARAPALRPVEGRIGMALRHVNAVIVGAGAGGGVVAKELATAGMSVALLERGKWYSAADCRKDDLFNQRTQVLGAKFGPDEERDPRVTVDAQGRESVVFPSDGGYSNNAACVGGGTFSYGAMAWRFHEKDFRMRTTYGEVEGSTLDDWPISYADLEPFYEKAEWEMGVSGDVSADPYKAPRRKGLPMPPLPPNREYQILHPAAKKLGLHPFDIPMLRNTVPYNGRRACMRCRWCVGFACELSARTGTHNTVIPIALATGNCELRTGCMTKEIMLDSRGHATGVAYFDADEHLQEQTADLVIVCGGAIESARLLLNTRHKLFPERPREPL